MKLFTRVIGAVGVGCLALTAISVLREDSGAQTTNPPQIAAWPWRGTNPPATIPPFYGNFYGGFFTNNNAHIDTTGAGYFATVDVVNGLVAHSSFQVSGEMDVTGAFISWNTNAMSTWPIAPAGRGGIALVNSNGTLYALISGPNGNAWISTNHIAP